MIELNKKFRAYFLESSKCMDIVSYLLSYCIEIKDKPRLWASLPISNDGTDVPFHRTTRAM